MPIETIAEEVPGSGPDRVLVSPDLAVPRRVGVKVWDEPAYEFDIDLMAEWDEDQSTWDITDMQIRSKPDGPGVSSDAIRRLQVNSLLRLAVQFIEIGTDVSIHGDGNERLELTDEQARDLANQRALEPRLLWVARIYRLAQITLEAPTKAVAEKFDVPHRTATYWVSLARRRGLLDH